jgi:Rrf2 family iron-sulfur cluster assembly transcriptional regulator
MILSQSAVYALRAALLLAEADDEGRMRVDDMAAALGAPRNYLSKILHALAREGIVDSARGPGGGFRLGAPPDEIVLEQVIRPFDDLVSGSRCLLGRAECLDSDPCPAHARWRAVSAEVRAFFSGNTLADLRKAPSSVPRMNR